MFNSLAMKLYEQIANIIMCMHSNAITCLLYCFVHICIYLVYVEISTDPGWEKYGIVGGQLSIVVGIATVDFTVALGLEGFLFLVHLLLQSSDTSVFHREELSRPVCVCVGR